MNHHKILNSVRQQRLYDNLRWYLKKQPLLQVQARAGDADTIQLVAAFEEANATLAESKIDLFNELAERYRASNAALNAKAVNADLCNTARN